MVERLSEQILRRWENFTAKGRLLYYKEKYKRYVKEKGRRRGEGNSLQQAPHPTSFTTWCKQRFKYRNNKRCATQSNTHAIGEQDDCRAANKNNQSKGESIKRGRKKLANRDTNK